VSKPSFYAWKKKLAVTESQATGFVAVSLARSPPAVAGVRLRTITASVPSSSC